MTKVLHAYTVAYSALTLSNGLFGYLADQGYVNDIVVSSHYGESAALKAQPGVHQVHELGMTRHFTPRQDVEALRSARELLRGGDYSLVHTNSPKASLLVAAAARSLGPQRPVVLYMVRGLPLESRQGLEARLARRAERTTGALADSVIYVSKSLQRAADRHGVLASHGCVLGFGSSNGVDTDAFSPAPPAARRAARATLGWSDEHLVAGFVGRLTADKGVDRLRRMWPLVRERNPNARLLVVGALDEDYPSGGFVHWAEREPTVHLAGHLVDVREAYAAMDLVVLPTHREGLPNVLLEAGAWGLPVVATPVTGCTDVVVDGVTGHLVPGDATDAWAATITGMSSDERRIMGAAARRHIIERFDQQQVWQLLCGHYAELLNRREVRR